MIMDLLVEISHNLLTLLLIGIVHEISHGAAARFKLPFSWIMGVLCGGVGILLIYSGYQLLPGIILDARSVFIGVLAFAFGGTVSITATLMMVVYRVLAAGPGIIPGISILIACNIIGLLWRKFFADKKKNDFWNITLFGVILQVATLLCWLMLPWKTAKLLFEQASLTIFLIHAIASVLVTQLIQVQMGWHKTYRRAAEANELYRALYEDNHAVVLLLKPEQGNILNANEAACKFYGYPREAMQTLSYRDLFPEIADHPNIFNSKIEQDQSLHFESKSKKATGEIVDVEVYAGAIQYEHNSLIYAIIHDITQRVLAMNALKASENRQRLLIEGAPDAIFIELNGKIQFANQTMLKLLGASKPEELIGTSVLDHIRADYHEIARMRMRAIEAGESNPPIEEVYLRMDGSEVEVEVKSVSVGMDGMNGGFVFVRDITERKELERKKAEVDAQMRQQQKLEAIGTLAGGVAHEINNPINGIMNYAQLIQDEVGENREIYGYSQEIINETKRISEIVRNLLQFSRQEKQSHSYASVYDIINQTMSLIKTVIKRDQITLDVQLDENIPDIKCRSQQIQQVLMNLLTNARDALNEKYPEYDEDKIIRVRCVHFFEAGRRWIRLTVEDHGTGIPASVREKIFEPFFSTKPKELGTGLGLSISHGIVKDHHGKFEIETQEGKFSRFHVILPVDNGWTLS